MLYFLGSHHGLTIGQPVSLKQTRIVLDYQIQKVLIFHCALFQPYNPVSVVIKGQQLQLLRGHQREVSLHARDVFYSLILVKEKGCHYLTEVSLLVGVIEWRGVFRGCVKRLMALLLFHFNSNLLNIF